MNQSTPYPQALDAAILLLYSFDPLKVGRSVNSNRLSSEHNFIIEKYAEDIAQGADVKLTLETVFAIALIIGFAMGEACDEIPTR